MARKSMETVDENGVKWRRLPAWPSYEVSEFGQIRHRHTKRVRAMPDNGPRRTGWVSLHRTDGVISERKSVRLDEAVASAWIGKPTKKKPKLVHVDGDKRNCAVSNLEYRGP